MEKATASSLAQQLITYYQKLIPECKGSSGKPCEDDVCQQRIAQRHETKSGLFIRMRNPTAGSGKIYSALQMQTLLAKAGTSCKTHVIAFDPYVENNAAIKAMPVKDIDANPNYVYYGYEVFEGIFPNNPSFFTFYLAYTDGESDIIFAVQYADGKENRYYHLSSILNRMPAQNLSVQKLEANILPCQDPDYRLRVARAHSIRLDTFQHNLVSFWETRPIPPAYIIMWNVLEITLDSGHCETQRVRLEWKDDDYTNNTLTGFNFEGTVSLAQDVVRTYYSIELFYGIHFLNEAQEFRFYKGRNDENDLTILIEVICRDGSHQYFDLSNDVP